MYQAVHIPQFTEFVQKTSMAILTSYNHLLWQKSIGVEDLNQTSNISHTSVGNNIVDHSDVVGASSVGAAPTTSSFST